MDLSGSNLLQKEQIQASKNQLEFKRKAKIKMTLAFTSTIMSGPGSSKLTMSLVNQIVKISNINTEYTPIFFFGKNVRSFYSAKAGWLHIFCNQIP